MRISQLLLFLPLAAASADVPPPAYASLAYLAGSCWEGVLPGGKDVDTHCFSWVYGGKFLRDNHTVHGAGHEDSLGETIYFWDSVAQKLQYLYIESAGGATVGTVKAAGDTVFFPDTLYQEDGHTQVYRSRWQKSGDDAYDVITEFKNKDGWLPGFSAHMKRITGKS
jgi:hypothetical protein